MYNRTLHGAEIQIPLDLEPTINAGSESALRAAYHRLHLSRRLSFEHAMANRALAIGIRNLADAMARKVSARHTSGIRTTH